MIGQARAIAGDRKMPAAMRLAASVSATAFWFRVTFTRCKPPTGRWRLYGKFGGPGYTSHGATPRDALDAVFQEHDQAYLGCARMDK